MIYWAEIDSPIFGTGNLEDPMSRSTSEERPELDILVQRKLVEKGEHLNRLIQSFFFFFFFFLSDCFSFII